MVGLCSNYWAHLLSSVAHSSIALPRLLEHFTPIVHELWLLSHFTNDKAISMGSVLQIPEVDNYTKVKEGGNKLGIGI